MMIPSYTLLFKNKYLPEDSLFRKGRFHSLWSSIELYPHHIKIPIDSNLFKDKILIQAESTISALNQLMIPECSLVHHKLYLICNQQSEIFQTLKLQILVSVLYQHIWLQ
uniref:Uncharacterized protein n=1 Tax=Cacopsylla melanoneura TaxID=428564 RepID=A0A8D8TVR2_9HEMI